MQHMVLYTLLLEISSIEAESFRLKEAKEQALIRKEARAKNKSCPKDEAD